MLFRSVHFKKIILILSGYDDKLHVPADSCIATDYASNDDETSNLILASDVLLMKTHIYKCYIYRAFFYI